MWSRIKIHKLRWVSAQLSHWPKKSWSDRCRVKIPTKTHLSQVSRYLGSCTRAWRKKVLQSMRMKPMTPSSFRKIKLSSRDPKYWWTRLETLLQLLNSRAQILSRRFMRKTKTFKLLSLRGRSLPRFWRKLIMKQLYSKKAIPKN